MWSVRMNPRGQSWFWSQQSTENTTKTLMRYKSGFHWKTHHDVAFRIFLPFRQYQRVYKGLLNAHQTAKNVPVDHINTSCSPSLISIQSGTLKTTINHTRPHPKCLPSLFTRQHLMSKPSRDNEVDLMDQKWSFHHFAADWNISTTIEWIIKEVWTYNLGTEKQRFRIIDDKMSRTGGETKDMKVCVLQQTTRSYRYFMPPGTNDYL